MPLGPSAGAAWAPSVDRASETAVVLDVVDGDLKVLADPQGLHQIFRNLLENALRHVGEGGTIRLAVTAGGAGFIEIAVSDDGEGIPAESLPRIFERFYRADSARAREVGGTGLGLAIVRHLVVAMGGSVSAESELGRGTTIRFTLPKG